jgi:prepilin signal peptidase PulO-like enzyme (type II secretory pathway)
MKKAVAILAVLASIPFLTFGVLFLIAAAAGPGSRLLVAAALLIIGVVLLVLGLRRLRRLAAITPEALKTGAVNLARRLGGELTVAQLRAEYEISHERAQQVLIELENEGTVEQERREDRVVYVFTGLLPSMAEKVCPYCGTELPVRSALRKCPNCGAQLEIEKT